MTRGTGDSRALDCRPVIAAGQRPERIGEAWPPATLARLRELKKRYDPDNVFRDNFNIDPLGE